MSGEDGQNTVGTTGFIQDGDDKNQLHADVKRHDREEFLDVSVCSEDDCLVVIGREKGTKVRNSAICKKQRHESHNIRTAGSIWLSV